MNLLCEESERDDEKSKHASGSFHICVMLRAEARCLAIARPTLKGGVIKDIGALVLSHFLHFRSLRYSILIDGFNGKVIWQVLIHSLEIIFIHIIYHYAVV